MRTNLMDLVCSDVAVTGDWAPLVAMGRDYYQKGKLGHVYEQPPIPPETSLRVFAAVDHFLQACWRQGEQDRIHP